MKRSKTAWFFSDFLTQFRLRIKLLLHDRMACAAFLLSAAVFFLLFLELNLQAEERAAVPIGIANCDVSGGVPTALSKELVEGLAEIQVLFVYEGTLEEMEKMLYDGYISCIFAIEEGYEERILRGETKELITVYQGEEDELARIVSDIVAGEMMYQVCLSKGVRIYGELPEGPKGKHSYQEYRDYAAGQKESGEFDYSFQITYVDTEQNGTTVKSLNNSLFYRQMLAGIAAMLYSFVVLSALNQTVAEQERGLKFRKKLIRLPRLTQAAGDLGAVLLLAAGLSAIFAFCLGYSIKRFSILPQVWGISMLFCLTFGIIFLLLGQLVRRSAHYQIAGAAIVMLCGITGLCTILEGIWMPEIKLLHTIPNAWFIRAIGGVLEQLS